jgi:hypothetical protein
LSATFQVALDGYIRLLIGCIGEGAFVPFNGTAFTVRDGDRLPSGFGLLDLACEVLLDPLRKTSSISVSWSKDDA